MSTVPIVETAAMLADEQVAIVDADNALNPPGRWLGRQFIGDHRHPNRQAAKFPAEVSVRRCAELAEMINLHLEDFIELTDIGGGAHESYVVAEGGITFRRWEVDYINLAPRDWQVEMRRDNRTAPQLIFPCAPAELLQFVDTAIGIHCFSVPDTFRQAVLGGVRHDERTESVTFGEPVMEAQVDAGLTPTNLSQQEHTQNSVAHEPKAHIRYIANLQLEFECAKWKSLLRHCIDRAGDPGSPFEIHYNDLSLKGTATPIAESTFSNWLSDARGLIGRKKRS